MGACPGGWHLPDTTEWNTLLEEVGGKDSAVVQLISSNGWSRKDYALSVLDSMLEDINPEGRSELPQAWGGTDSYGFSALPAGFRTDNDIFTTATGMAVFWTSVNLRIARNTGVFTRITLHMELCQSRYQEELGRELLDFRGR